MFSPLIQAAVALYHAVNGNTSGALRLYHRGLQKSQDYPAVYRGFPISDFWRQMQIALAGVLEHHSQTWLGPRPHVNLAGVNPSEG